MNIIIKEVVTRTELLSFIKFPFLLYSKNENWVPPLILDELHTLSRKKNPAFEFCDAKYWLAYRENKIVGRIAGIINYKYNEKWGKKLVRFGWFDFIDDNEVSALLLTKVQEWGIASGMNEIHGPLGFTDFDGEGMLIEGFDELATFGSIYNYPYYKYHIEKNNFIKDTDWVEYVVTLNDTVPEKIARLAKTVAERYNLHYLRVNKTKEMLPYARDIFYLINEAYKDLFGFVELTDKQIDVYVKQYFDFIKPGFVPIILDKNKKLVGFGITMPSISRAIQKAKGRLFPLGFLHILRAMKNNPAADLYLTAVRPEYQNKGVNAMIICEINHVFIKNKITRVETNRELEENSKIQAQWRFFESRLHKRRRCYKKSLI